MLLLGGEIVDAYGDLSRGYRLHSVRKSRLGTLYGVALARGATDTAATLGQLHIQEGEPLTEEECKATVRHLLQSRSGVFLPATFENAGFDTVRPERASHPAGAHWFYSNWDSNAAGTAYQIMTGENLFRAQAGPLEPEDYVVAGIRAGDGLSGRASGPRPTGLLRGVEQSGSMATSSRPP